MFEHFIIRDISLLRLDQISVQRLMCTVRTNPIEFASDPCVVCLQRARFT